MTVDNVIFNEQKKMTRVEMYVNNLSDVNIQFQLKLFVVFSRSRVVFYELKRYRIYHVMCINNVVVVDD